MCRGLWPCHPWGGAQGSRLGHAFIAKSAQDFVVLRNDDSLGLGGGTITETGGAGGGGWRRRKIKECLKVLETKFFRVLVWTKVVLLVTHILSGIQQS